MMRELIETLSRMTAHPDREIDELHMDRSSGSSRHTESVYDFLSVKEIPAPIEPTTLGPILLYQG